MENSADPDQLASSEPNDLDLHCLQIQGIPGLSRTSVKVSKCKCLKLIKALTALVGRLSLSLSVIWENGPERGLKTLSFNP